MIAIILLIHMTGQTYLGYVLPGYMFILFHRIMTSTSQYYVTAGFPYAAHQKV